MRNVAVDSAAFRGIVVNDGTLEKSRARGLNDSSSVPPPKAGDESYNWYRMARAGSASHLDTKAH